MNETNRNIKKKIILFGATGLVGKTLFKILQKKRYDICVVSRDAVKAKQILKGASYYLSLSDTDMVNQVIDGSYGIINLAGAPIIGKRWSREYKKIILESRIQTTNQIISAIKKAKHKPQILINASAVGYYGTSTQDECTENTSPGDDFLAHVCVEWEKEAEKARVYGTRVVAIRTGIVLEKNEGALKQIVRPYHLFLGGPIGSGRQWFPWIHAQDEAGIIAYALDNKEVEGAINAVAPEIVTNKTFSQILGNILHRPSTLPVPAIFLKIIFGEAAEVLLTGVSATSKKAIDIGYTFLFPTLQKTLENIFV